MKTTKLILGVLILGALVLLNSCGSGSSSSPAATVKEFSNKVEKGDFEGAIGCIATDGKAVDKEAKGKLTLLLGMAKGEVDKKKGIKDMEVLSETIDPDGKTATVKMKFTYGDGSVNEESNSLVKEDGKWKLSLQKQ
ncbi:MAG TPA: DUF4878 domain-containing protein [Bacteroidales bacterium]|jgi:hypothetical protein|nr:DUF4878 domain-containing protein [Bacteroidales bacterium]